MNRRTFFGLIAGMMVVGKITPRTSKKSVAVQVPFTDGEKPKYRFGWTGFKSANHNLEAHTNDPS